MGKYVPVKDQCWIKRCHNTAQIPTTLQGTVRILCKKHAREFGSSAEKA